MSNPYKFNTYGALSKTRPSLSKAINDMDSLKYLLKKGVSETDKILNPIKTNTLRTFPTVEKTAIATIRSETVSRKASSDMFNRLFIIGKSRDIDLEEM